MDKSLILEWLVQDADRNAEHHYNRVPSLQKALDDIKNQHSNPLPHHLPRQPERIVQALQQHFKNKVTFISLVLNHHFPEQYFFYRVSKLEKEIFEGFEFFSDIVPEFGFRFPRVGGTGFDRYLKLNEALLGFARRSWPKCKNPQKRLMYFLYEGLGRLFTEGHEHNPYWVMATHDEYWEALDSGEDVEWSGTKEMAADDLVFMYRTSPRKAITDIYRATGDPLFDPWSGWDGFEVEMKRVCAIEDIPFADMAADQVLGEWGTVKKRFVGTVAEPIPPRMYNRLLEIISIAKPNGCRLKPAPTVGDRETGKPPDLPPPTLATPWLSGLFALEGEFEDEILRPLFKQWGFKHVCQHYCCFRIGSQDYHGEADFYVSDEEGPLTLYEDKLRILKLEDLDSAVRQAKSYALLLGLPSFVVASPEGMWLYALSKNRDALVGQISGGDLKDQQSKFRSLLLDLRRE